MLCFHLSRILTSVDTFLTSRLHHTISVIQVFQVGEGCPSDAPKLILSGAPHDPVYNKIEKQCRHNTPMSDISVDFK